jgi:para-nitrobenzyl esterase
MIAEASIGGRSGVRENGVLSFHGIPYARPPIGKFRFRSPRPIESLEPSPISVDRNSVAAPIQWLNPAAGWIYDPPHLMDEGCLTLNVWTPRTDAKLPVLVWLNGGAWRAGHGNVAVTNGRALALAGQVVVVTVTSRQGALGWLGHPDLVDSETGAFANWSIQDQVEAFRWIKRNIAIFGGDPDNVTAIGQSAGGQTIAVMAQFHSAERLFNKAILQSSAMFGAPRFMDQAQAFGYCERLASRLGCTVSGLKEIPALALQLEELRLSNDPDAQRHLGGHRYLPFVDGRIIPGWPFERPIGDIPILIGTNRNETNFFFNLKGPGGKILMEDIPSDEKLVERVHAFSSSYYPFDDRPSASAVVDHFRKCAQGNISAKALWLDITTDVNMRGYAYRAAAMQAGAGAPAYLYEFAEPLVPPGEGSPHCSEMPFVFGTFSDPHFQGKVGNDERARKLSDSMMNAWSSFARGGVPALLNGKAWPAFNPVRPSAAIFGGPEAVTVVEVPRRQELTIWPTFLAGS